ncbi:Putative sulfatase, alkaline-phosphatase-like, core domain superfamily [Septoria linicola]|uniref:Sulfatase, alkaline-phosphatase-like, core domain superfamily n=1 Tax=Septoria linicola TaxID=215465 RepID=A0A9Q9EJC7_9PEZI|nr:Putative sulfatase, alkaline-phosphatase-like, core domain superfamily [Septoria linicola]
MRVADDLTYFDLGLVRPQGGHEVGDLFYPGVSLERKVPNTDNPVNLTLTDAGTGELFRFETQKQLAELKFQRYMQRYLRVVQSVDDNVGRVLHWLDKAGLVNDTLVMYTSECSPGDHGWFDKRFIYEDSFQMSLLARYPQEIAPGTVVKDIVQNVDFAATMLDVAGLPTPSYMQGKSFRKSLQGQTPEPWDQLAYHRYWMHRDAIHNAYAHCGVRDKRYKLIYWYNEGFNLTGTSGGGEEQQWELFDTQEEPFELFNVYNKAEYANVRRTMTDKLERKMLDIGDIWVHDAGAIRQSDKDGEGSSGLISNRLKEAKRHAVNH